MFGIRMNEMSSVEIKIGSIAAALLFIALTAGMRSLGFSWNSIGVIAQFIVAIIALGGYCVTYIIFQRQEAHKYHAAVVVNFNRQGEDGTNNAMAYCPGFVLKFEGPNQVLHADFKLDDIGDTPVTDVRMNFYLHDIKAAGQPKPFFENDVLLADGIATGGSVAYNSPLRSHKIRKVNGGNLGVVSLNPSYLSEFSYLNLFIAPIPSDRADGIAKLSSWTLVIKYRNLLGNNYFSAYKLEGPEVANENTQMRFFGAFPGDYLRDDKHHQFIANRGFPDKKAAPNWEGVMDTIARAEGIAKAAISEIYNTDGYM